jgi:hypothetical protein
MCNCNCAQVAFMLLGSCVVRLGSQMVKMTIFKSQNLPKWNHQVNAGIQGPWHNHHHEHTALIWHPPRLLYYHWQEVFHNVLKGLSCCTRMPTPTWPAVQDIQWSTCWQFSNLTEWQTQHVWTGSFSVPIEKVKDNKKSCWYFLLPQYNNT